MNEAGLYTQVLILSMYSDTSLVKKAFRFGARGYLLKKSVSDDLIEAVRLVSQRKVYLSPELLKTNPQGFFLPEIEDPPDNLFDLLTSREREICELIVQGYTNSGIANKLGISIKTVEKHRANLMEKLRFQDVATLIREVILQGLVFSDETKQ